MTINDFINEKNISLGNITVRDWLYQNREKLKGIVFFKENKKRTTIRILDADKLFKILIG